jgi:rubredoxin
VLLFAFFVRLWRDGVMYVTVYHVSLFTNKKEKVKPQPVLYSPKLLKMLNWKIFNLAQPDQPGGVNTETCWGEIELTRWDPLTTSWDIKQPWRIPSRALIVTTPMSNPEEEVHITIECPVCPTPGEWEAMPNYHEVKLGLFALFLKKDIWDNEWVEDPNTTDANCRVYVPWRITLSLGSA